MVFIKKIESHHNLMKDIVEYTLFFDVADAAFSMQFSNEMLYAYGNAANEVIADSFAKDISHQIYKEILSALETPESTPNADKFFNFKDAVHYEIMPTQSAQQKVETQSGYEKALEMFEHLPQLKGVSIKCPACGYTENVMNIIVHLNDIHVWKREAIADWLESTDLDLEFKTDEK